MNNNPLDFGVKNLPNYLELIDKKLKSLAPTDIPGVGRLLQAHGKRLRPSLVIAIAAHSNKKVDETVINAATAVELVHIASLVHDDIIDSGTLRWGIPTINSTEGNDIALLGGDYLLASGCALAASVSAEAAAVIAETIAELCIGQARELKDHFNTERSIEPLNLTIKGKTSSMFIAACKLGGLVSGLSSVQKNALSSFAENFGIAFQYLDDIKDFTEHSKVSDKSASSDVQEGNYTLPIILSLQGPNKTALKKLLKTPKVSTEEVLKILEEDESLKKTLIEAGNYREKALSSLSGLSIPELRDSLQVFIDSVYLPEDEANQN